MDPRVLRSRPAGFGGLEPGETIQLPFPPSGSGGPPTAHINAVIFEDRTAVGEGEQIASMFRQRLAYASEWGRWALVMEEDPARSDAAREAEIAEMIRVLREDPEKSGSAAVVAGRMAARRALRSLLMQSKPETRTALLAYVQERAATQRRHAQWEGPIGYIAPAVALANDVGKRCETPGAGPVITQQSSCGVPGALLRATGRAAAFCAQAAGGQTAKTSSTLSAAALGSCGVSAPEDRTYVPECKPEFFTTTSSSASSATITGVNYSFVPSVGCTIMGSQSAAVPVNVTAGVEVLTASDDCGVAVQSTDITTDNIRVVLSGPAAASGSLVLYLTDQAGADHLITALPSPPVGPGTYDRSFRLSTLASAEYVSVKAVWNPNSITLTGTRSYHFKVLGTLTHTVYNSPAETNCSGSDVPVKVFTSSCAVSSGQMKSGFVNRLQDPEGGTGSGHSIRYNDVQNEAWCSGRDASSFRRDVTITGTMGAVSDSTVAVCPTDEELHQPGLRLYIAGLGVKTVADNCPKCCGRNRIDHYSTSTACSAASLPNAITVLLY